MDQTEIIVRGENIHKTYLLGTEGVSALRGVEVTVTRGEFLLIYGTSGGGKSSLLNVLGTIDTPTKGNLQIFNERITEHSPDKTLASLRNEKVGFVFQSFNLLPTMNALDNVSLPMLIAGRLTADEIKKKATLLLEKVGLSGRLLHFPPMLSGGEQQRVAIARALANDPEILFLDEPTGDLDTKNTQLIMKILLGLNETRKLTMIMVSHDVYMKQYANRVIYIRDGRVQNTEIVERKVRKIALEKLNQSQNNTTVEKVDTKYRSPSDYETFPAHKELNFNSEESADGLSLFLSK